MYYPTDPASYAGKCPANSNEVAAPLCEVDAGQAPYDQSTADTSHNDLAQMRQIGFDMVRLTLNWSQLEPTPGNYDTPYLEQVAQAMVVLWALARLNSPAKYCQKVKKSPTALTSNASSCANW